MQKENTTASEILSLASKGYSVTKDTPPPRPKRRMDAWINETSNFGIQHATNNTFHAQSNALEQEQLESMYSEDWVTRKGCDMPAEDMTRKGVKFKVNEGDENDQEKIEDIENILNKEYNWMKKAQEAISFSRLSGGSATVFNFGGSEYEQRDPVEEWQIKSIKWVDVIPAWDAIPVSWYQDFDNPKFKQPEHYQIVYRGASVSRTVITHESRIILMQGRQSTPGKLAINRGWSESYVDACYNAIRDFQVASSSASGTMEDFVWKSLGVKDLAQKVMNREDDLILDRLYWAAQKLHVGNISIYDAEGEKMEKNGSPVTGLADLWDRFGDIICAVWNIPRSMMYGAESGSLGGASAESDRDNYFDNMRSMQENKLRPWLQKFIHFVSLVSKFEDTNIRFDFNSLREKSSSQVIDERLKQAQTDQIYLTNQVVTPEEVAESRFSKSEPDLDSMNVDFEEREKQEELNENTEGNMSALEEILKSAGMNNKNQENDTEEKEEPEPKQKEEKQDQIIFSPQIKVESPVVNVPAQKDNSKSIKYIIDKLDKLESSLDRDFDVDIDTGVNYKTFRLNGDFNEADHPRDEDGKFTSGGGGGSAGVYSESDADDFSDEIQEKTPEIKKVKREDLPEDVIYHTSPKKIEKIENRGGNFQDSLFFSADEYAMGKVEATYAMDISDKEFISPSRFFYHDDYEKLNNIVDDIKNYSDVDEDTARGLLDGSEDPFELMEDGEEASELSWYLQGKQGEAAKKLGYDGAKSEDEQGTVYIIPMLGRESDLMEVTD